jgi:hypothetical protein
MRLHLRLISQQHRPLSRMPTISAPFHSPIRQTSEAKNGEINRLHNEFTTYQSPYLSPFPINILVLQLNSLSKRIVRLAVLRKGSSDMTTQIGKHQERIMCGRPCVATEG